MNITAGQRSAGTLDVEDELAMYRLRHRVFYERLSWDVRGSDAMEYDEYDQLDAAYVIVKNDEDVVFGCWRMLPTTGPYMLRDVFPQLLGDQPAPQDDTVWELSRFAVESAGGGNPAFSPIVVATMCAAVRYALDRGVNRFVTVTTAAIERMLKRLGVKTRRLCTPMSIGVERMTLAIDIDIDEALHTLLCAHVEAHAAAARQPLPAEPVPAPAEQVPMPVAA